MNNNILNLVAYSKQSFVVRGGQDPAATKYYMTHLKNLGGTLNYRLKEADDENKRFTGYIFPNKKIDKVTEFVDKVNSGEIGGSQPPPRDETKQSVFYKVEKPQLGQIMNLHINGSTHRYNILSVEGNKVITRVYAQPIQGGDQVRVIIADGKWNIWGIWQEHEVSFAPCAPPATYSNMVQIPNQQTNVPMPPINAEPQAVHQQIHVPVPSIAPVEETVQIASNIPSISQTPN